MTWAGRILLSAILEEKLHSIKSDETPAMEKLASEGMKFTDAYAHAVLFSDTCESHDELEPSPS